MTAQGWLLILVFTVLVVAIAKPMGVWLFALYEGRRTPLHVALGPVERLFYKAGGVDPAKEQGWRGYAVSMLLFNLAGILFLYALQRLQGVLPLNPQGFDAVSGHLAFNTAISFVTNTNWQSYGG
ncbi:MAG: potassium-transporting ATPase subunit KdpA, partial [Sphingomonadaceae bacterium]|nr:potassium-transporting ATPase subunit KdpA [Sphingomonadaceae bacterium]